MGIVFPVRDSDGAVISRQKVTTTGWHLQFLCFEFETSKLGSDLCKDDANADTGFTVDKFYQSNGGELTTQETITASCVKSVITLEPTWDYDIIGGMFFQPTVPGADLYLTCIAVPDIAAQYGGSVPFCTGFNLKNVAACTPINIDGKTPKTMYYSAQNHTNKFKFVFNHGTGVQHKFMMTLQIFRA